MSLLANIRSELTSFGRTEKLFVFFAMLTGFLISSEYAIARPASQSLLLTIFSVQVLPWIWLATVPLNLAAIYLYSRFLPKIGPLRMLTYTALSVIGVNILTSYLFPIYPSFILFQFAWKDIYVILMFKQLWSLIHTTIAASRAKYLFGFIFGMGTMGGIFGSFVPSHFAVSIGSEKLFLFTLPLYLLLIFAYRNAYLRSLVSKDAFEHKLTTNPSPKEGFSLIRKNKFLGAVLLLVVLMQVSVGLIEYQFNAHLELNILEKDLRTAYYGSTFVYVSLLSGIFQIVGSFLMVRTLGLRGSHLLIPLLLLGSAVLSLVIPTFALITFSFVFLKAVDFSLFGVVREMLYIPLQLDEKFRAKAIIDVFAYRSSKALLSLVLLVSQLFVGSYLLALSPYLSIAVFIAWASFAYLTFRKYSHSLAPNI